MAVVHMPRPRPRPLPIPPSACKTLGAFGLHIDRGAAARFRLRRRKGEAEVWMHLGNFQWSLNITEDVHPKTFAEARKVVAAYAWKHGQAIEEIRAEAPPRGTKADYALAKVGGAKEEWLASDVPALFAEAMMKCEHSGGHCAYDGYCHYGGCFEPT